MLAIILLASIGLSAQNGYLRVEITNPDAIRVLGKKTLEVSIKKDQAIPPIGTKIIIGGHTNDDFWKFYGVEPYLVLEKEFHFMDYVPSQTFGGKPNYLEFNPEEMFYLHATIIAIAME